MLRRLRGYLFLFLLFHFNLVLTKSPSVIIIGAGSAGIAAATKLLENSITNITIIEAENRVGGRVKSVKFGNGFVDEGAQYCHGEKGNVVYELVKDLDILDRPKIFAFEKTKIYKSDGSILPADITADIYNIVGTYDDGIRVEHDLSLGESFLEHFNATVLKKYTQDDKKLKIIKDSIRLLHHLIMMHEGAFSWDRPASGRHYGVCEGDQQLTWKTKGYQIALDVLMKSYPDPTKKLPIDDKILFDKKVDKITWSENQISVKLNDDSVLTAEHVIFTPSIGVLREHHNTLFEPKLPKEKINAIDGLGFDGIMKIILHFPEIWWKENEGVFFFLWNEEDLAKVKDEFPDGPQKDGVSWVSHISALVRVNSNPNVLIAWVSSDLLPEIEKTSDEILLKGTMYVIKKFLGKDRNITEADKVLKSQWNINPNFRGTYSFEKVGHFDENVSNQAILAEPLVNKEGHPGLLFAGEATHPIHYSTVHGAIESGRREAERIINLHKQS